MLAHLCATIRLQNGYQKVISEDGSQLREDKYERCCGKTFFVDRCWASMELAITSNTY